MKKKKTYAVNKFNQLILRHNGLKKPIEGEFSVDKQNRLSFKSGVTSKINFKGSWSLNRNHDLEFVLSDTKEKARPEVLVFRGTIISTKFDSLAFELKRIDFRGQSHLQVIELTGAWQTDEFNRIIFLVKKEYAPDKLILSGQWQVNRNQQIVYKYEKTSLKTREKTNCTLGFSGYWQISEPGRLTYNFEHSSVSRFDFKVAIESPSLYPKEGCIKYRLGIGAKEEAAGSKTVVLFGNWRLNKDFSLDFEMGYGNRIKRSIKFGAQLYLTRQDSVVLSLSNSKNRPLGICITFSHKFLKKSGDFFLRLEHSGKSSGLEAGLTFPF